MKKLTKNKTAVILIGLIVIFGLGILYIFNCSVTCEHNTEVWGIKPRTTIENVIVYRYQPSYAEKAEVREDDVKREFDQLPTARPVPTFGVSGGMTFGSGTITPTPAVDPLVTETPVSPLDETTPSPSVEPEGNGVADGTTPAPNLSYEDVPGTPTPPPTPTPTPSPTPTPTFSIHDMTVEED